MLCSIHLGGSDQRNDLGLRQISEGRAGQGREVRVGQGRVRQSRAGLACLRALPASVLALILGSNLASPLLIQLADGQCMRGLIEEERCGSPRLRTPPRGRRAAEVEGGHA